MNPDRRHRILRVAASSNKRFVPVKSAEQQALLALHRVRQGFIEERTALINRSRRVAYPARVANEVLGHEAGNTRPIDRNKPYQRFGERRASAVVENKTTLAARPFHLKCTPDMGMI